MTKLELLAPGGDLERLKMAVIYGADAVYIGGTEFGMRANAATFDEAVMAEGIAFAHDNNAKIYVTVNIFPHNGEIDRLPKYIQMLKSLGADGIIVGDIGVMSLVKQHAPGVPIHMSVQANITNYQAALQWVKLGASRLIVSREISLTEIKRIRDEIPNEVELEAFVHGAMCLSYSGRCYLSSYMSGRDANHGECSQPCRYKYFLMEETNPGQYYPVYQDENGAHILNAKDLNMIEHIPEMVEAGITSFKIEGRAKTSFYVSTVIRAYRSAIDYFCENPNDYKMFPEWQSELNAISHREYNTGFYLGQPFDSQTLYTSSYMQECGLIGVVIGSDGEKLFVEQRNKFSVGDTIEALQPDGQIKIFKVEKMYNSKNVEIQSAPHAKMEVIIPTDIVLPQNTMLRKRL